MTAVAKVTNQWQALFESWPDAIERRGAIVTNQGESFPFCDFLISDGLLLVERDGPDSTGTRKIIVSYDSISMVKFPTAGELSRFQAMGFQAPL